MGINVEEPGKITGRNGRSRKENKHMIFIKKINTTYTC
jgi:hypothetical protein